MNPSIGRIVIYVIPQHTPATAPVVCPAIITRVWSPTCVNLRLLPDHDQESMIHYHAQQETPTSVQYDENKTDRTWHWPERVRIDAAPEAPAAPTESTTPA